MTAVEPSEYGDGVDAVDRLDAGVARFVEQYAADEDPWGFATRWYERRKYALTVAALPRARYRRAVEPGCANGELTRLLAPRCDELWAFDVVPQVVARARHRVRGLPHVRVTEGRFPQHWPAGRGDLVVWSEVAYYLTEAGAAVALEGLDRWLEPGGTLIAVHYTGPTDHPRPGDAIVPWLDAAGFLDRVGSYTDPSFELAVWERQAARFQPPSMGITAPVT